MGLLYTPMKIFHYPEKMTSLPRQTDEIKPPIHVRIKPTNICNHNCWYCAYRAENLQLGKDMNPRDFIPKEKMLEITEDLIEMGVKAVTFSGGGEPFCYPYLEPVVEKLADSRISFASLTNGALMKGRTAELFARNASWIRLSMDGWDAESYARYRGRPEDEFSRVIKNIETFKGYGGPCCLGVVMIVDHDNWRHIHEFANLMKNLGVDSLKISPCIVSNDGAVNETYHRNIFESVRDVVDRAVAELRDESFEIYDSYHMLDDKFDKPYTWCPSCQILSIIGADLNVYTCHDKAYNLETGLIGSIKHERYKDMWEDGKEKFFKVDPSRDCKHHCCANAKNQLIHQYLDVDPFHMNFV